jgi:acyl-CoA thioester hydrolase
VAREEFRFGERLRVRWAEVDPQGIVFNANYLTYFDVAMTEYFRAIGHPYPEPLAAYGSDLFVVHSEIDYHGSARFDDELDVLARTGRLGTSSMTLLFEIHRGDEHLISGQIVYVNADPESRRSLPLPAEIRQAITRFEKVAPQGA